MSNSLNLANRNTLWAAIFVEELARGGVSVACISPGSRSTPLTMALALHPEIRVFTHIDERSCGFFALGHAKTTGRPVVLVCTSGSAAANLHPAVIEASYGQVPLIVLTADRPPELRDTGAGQTIDQLNLYGRAARWFFEVGVPHMGAGKLRHLRSLAARALFEATRAPAGPVHLNFPFSKPLEPTPVSGDTEFEAAVAGLAGTVLVKDLPGEGLAGRDERGASPYSRTTRPAGAVEPAALRRIAGQVRAARRGLIACGPMPAQSYLHGNGRGGGSGKSDAGKDGAGNGWPEAVATLARLAGYPILADPHSQVRCGAHDTSQVIGYGEAILRAPAFREMLEPQLMLRFGFMPVGRHVEVLLEEHPACPVLLVNEGGVWLEPTHNPTELVCADPTGFCRDLAELLAAEKPARDTGWLEGFREAEKIAAEAIGEQFGGGPDGLGEEWFEGRAFFELAALLPEGTLQYSANSMPVRDADAFTPVSAKRVRFLVNRGANGIDGTLSSALGAAAAHQDSGAAAAHQDSGAAAAHQDSGAAAAHQDSGCGPAVLVTGDLAFYHDANGLLAAGKYGIDLLVVLLNNDGGGIFEMLPIRDFGEHYETHFGTPHGIDFQQLAASYGLPLVRPANWGEFRAMAREAISSGGTRIIEIFTERARNRLQHQQVWEAVAADLARAFPPGREFG